jgi:Fibronectin type III domain
MLDNQRHRPPAFRLRAWASTRELTSPPDAAEPIKGSGKPPGSGLHGLAGYGCVAVAVLLVIVGAAFGAGPHDASAALHGVEAWLTNDGPGSVTRVNGLSGRADARVRLNGTAGHRLKVIQDGSTILIEDLTAHTITRIDPSELAAAQTATMGTARSQIVAGAGLAYLVDPHAGIVQQIDPVSLTVEGQPVGPPTLAAPLGTGSAITADGTLWVPDDAAGTIVPVRHGAAGTQVAVGHRGDALSLTVANGQPAVVDASSATMTVLAAGGARTTINLPPAAGGGILAPPTSGATVPLLLSSPHQLVLVNTARDTVSSVPMTALAADRLDAPLILGSRVYVPDETQGALVTYDAATGAPANRIAIGSGPGQIDAFVQNGVLWANAPGGSQAVCVNADGTSYPINKYQPGLAGGPIRARHITPAQGGGPAGPADRGGGPQGPPAGNGTGEVPPTAPASRPTAPPSPPPPSKPGTPTETAQAGDILVAFTPSSTGTPLGYQLQGAPATATVTPSTVTARGPFQFTVSGLSCAQTYSFAVTALFAGGRATSPTGAGVRPCTAPGSPAGISAVPVNHGLDVTWQTAAPNGGTVSYTVAWSGGASGSRSGLTGTTYNITSLVNQKSYTVTVTAVNEAGASQAPATTTSTLLLPSAVLYHIYNNSKVPVNMRSQTNTGAPIITNFPVTPAGSLGVSVTVHCQVTGGPAQDFGDPALHGDIWDYVTGNGHTGWVSDLYVSTPSSSAGSYSSFSDPPLWQCT